MLQRQDAVQCKVVENNLCIAFLLTQTLWKSWMSFIFNEVPDRVSKNLVLFSLYFSADSFTNKAQFDAGFSERLKRKIEKDDTVPAISDPTVMSQHKCE